MKYSFLGLLAIVCISMVACSGGSQKTSESGVVVNFVNQSDGEAMKDSTILKFNLAYLNAEGNPLFGSTASNPIVIGYQKSTWAQTSQIHEVLELMKVGDSVHFTVRADDLFSRTFKMPLPDTISSNDEINIQCGFEFMKTKEEFQAYQTAQREKMLEEQRANMAVQLEEDGQAIDTFLSEKGIEAVITESGLRYVISKQGNGPTPEKGQTITAHYHGTFMDGKVFDSSVEKGKPFSTAIGVGRVIKGWDEAFTSLPVGTKATLYIPSSLAYGAGGRPGIPPNSNLIFEVELIDVQ